MLLLLEQAVLAIPNHFIYVQLLPQLFSSLEKGLFLGLLRYFLFSLWYRNRLGNLDLDLLLLFAFTFAFACSTKFSLKFIWVRATSILCIRFKADCPRLVFHYCSPFGWIWWFEAARLLALIIAILFEFGGQDTVFRWHYSWPWSECLQFFGGLFDGLVAHFLLSWAYEWRFVCVSFNNTSNSCKRRYV